MKAGGIVRQADLTNVRGSFHFGPMPWTEEQLDRIRDRLSLAMILARIGEIDEGMLGE